MQAMRILYALDSYRPNIDGVGISIERQALGLARKGHEVAILAPSQRFANYEESNPHIRVCRVRSIRVLLARWRLAALPARPTESFVDEVCPDVVVLSLPFPLNRAALTASRNRGIPTVGITGTMPEWLIYNLPFLRPFARALNSRLWRLIVAFYNKCDAVVAVTPTAMSLLREHGLERPVHVISNGVDLRQFKPRPRDEKLARAMGIPRKPTVLYAGRLDSEKCMDVWIRAIPDVLKELDAHFVVVGDGSEKERLVTMVGKMGLERHVTFVGFLKAADYCHVYSLADIFAISSPAELQSIVTLEAAASGVAIVAANAGALPELVQEGSNGFLFPEGESAAMANRILAILSEPGRAHRMGRESRAIAQRHDLERSIVKYEALYRGILDNPRQSSRRWEAA
ncbi:MAG: glycosyltransferase [Chloroflexi bacterium]|nr:glycosyltransferase [Chloroflexota bacterium]